MHTRHPSEETLYAFVDEQLDTGEASAVASHIETCDQCGAVVADARGITAAASRIVGALDGVPANVIPARPFRRLPPWLAAAAVVVLAVGVSSVAMRSGFESRERPQASASGERRAATAADEPARDAAVQMTQPLQESVSPGEVSTKRTASTSRAGSQSTREQVAVSSGAPGASVAVEPEAARILRAPSSPSAAGPPPPPPPASTDLAGTGAPGARSLAAQAQPEVREDPRQLKTDVTSDRATDNDRTISGRVVADAGQPLSGANVFISELNLSVGTDATGRYTLAIPSTVERAVVRVRAIGYAPESRSITTEDPRSVDFTLKRELTALSEAVVTGATTATERPVRGGAAAAVAGVAPAAAAVRGSAAPLRVTRYQARPGVVIELREFTSEPPTLDASSGVNEFRWKDAAGARTYVLSGALSRAELEVLARSLNRLTVVR